MKPWKENMQAHTYVHVEWEQKHYVDTEVTRTRKNTSGLHTTVMPDIKIVET